MNEKMKQLCDDAPQADASKVSGRAKKRGLPQLGTLGAGNHYAEIQVCGGAIVYQCDLLNTSLAMYQN